MQTGMILDQAKGRRIDGLDVCSTLPTHHNYASFTRNHNSHIIASDVIVKHRYGTDLRSWHESPSSLSLGTFSTGTKDVLAFLRTTRRLRMYVYTVLLLVVGCQLV
ncbi:hypothetical protein ACKLNR_006384 [Fusarium oxysporum f. sp. zingiberi]